MKLCDFIALCEARLGRVMTKRELKVLGRTYLDDTPEDADHSVTVERQTLERKLNMARETLRQTYARNLGRLGYARLPNKGGRWVFSLPANMDAGKPRIFLGENGAVRCGTAWSSSRVASDRFKRGISYLDL